MSDQEEALAHFGVKGMKWGVVRKRGANGRVGGEASDDYKRARSLRKKTSKQLTNQELRLLNERLQLEQQYASLTKKKSLISKVGNGHKVAKAILATGKTANSAVELYKSPVGEYLQKEYKKARNK